jgi:hypothetical protein
MSETVSLVLPSLGAIAVVWAPWVVLIDLYTTELVHE